MGKIKSETRGENYEVVITTETGHTIIADEPEALGGKNLGPNPNDLLAAALATCTSATVEMYVQRKGWDLKKIHTKISINREKPTDIPTIHREIKLEGDLTEDQIKRIMIIADKCPIHKALTNPLEINTELVE